MLRRCLLCPAGARALGGVRLLLGLGDGGRRAGDVDQRAVGRVAEVYRGAGPDLHVMDPLPLRRSLG